MMKATKLSIALLSIFWLGVCSAQTKQITARSISQLKYVNSFVLPHNEQFQQTTVGGLSSIDFDQANNVYYLVSDDRSHINPVRFYKAKIDVSAKGIDLVTITGVDTLRQKNGESYPKLTPHAKHTADPEALRYNALAKNVIWTSEGDRVIKPADTTLIDPTITIVSTDGKYLDSIPLPDNLRMQLTESGPRRNGVLEAITFADDFKNLYVSLEEPLYQDGPRADVQRNKAFVRIYKFNLSSKKNTAQYAYELEPVALPPAKADAEINNGIPDILWLGDNRMMITERSYSGGDGSNIKVFLADLGKADNIKGVRSIKESPVAHPVEKKLLLNMDQLGIYIDNIEGATFGPVLPNGHQSIIFVADNNFNKDEQSQFLLFEVIP